MKIEFKLKRPNDAIIESRQKFEQENTVKRVTEESPGGEKIKQNKTRKKKLEAHLY